MSQSVGVLDVSDFIAETASSLKQYYLVIEGTAAGQAKISGAAAEKVLGPIQNAPRVGQTYIDANEPLAIRILGTSKYVAAAAITRGAYCTSNGDGTVKATTTNGEYVCCEALEAASGAGMIFEGKVTAYRY